MDVPCLYLIDLGQSYNSQKVIKFGTTLHPDYRKFQYVTGNVHPVKYAMIFMLDPSCFKSKDLLYKLDSIQFPIYIHSQGWGHLKINGGGGTEFYLECDKLLELIRSFLKLKNIRVLEEVVNDPYHKRPVYSRYKELTFNEDNDKLNTLLSRFINTCVPYGSSLRRIQLELWDKFEGICETETPYKGIIQWPTGAGKTVGTLILIILALEACKKSGKFYRGLFVSPKNDILDTISHHFNKLSEFGISVFDGSHGKLKKLTIPMNSHVLIYTTHSSLTSSDATDMLPNITHVHYDEIHRITGDEYFTLLKECIVKWNTQFLTGTSATPKTCSTRQHEKLSELFGENLSILHRCDVDEAVQEGLIARPRILVDVINRTTNVLDSYLTGIHNRISQRKERGLWKGGKIIAYLRSIDDATYCIQNAHLHLPGAVIYGAVDHYRTDPAFVDAECDGTVRILFACERFREGSDIPGLEMTSVLMGKTIAAYILIQISGRALRNEYVGKEGWCLIARQCEDDDTDEDVYSSILLNVLDFISKSDRKYEKKEVERLVRMYIGDVNVDDNGMSVEETIRRIQAAYIRQEIGRGSIKEKYGLIRDLNRELKLMSRIDYEDSHDKHINFIIDPVKDFSNCWISWYDFLGVDTTLYPSTKHEWKRVCLQNGWTTRDIYNEKRTDVLPMNPSEMYPEFESWVSEFPQEEEIVW